MKQKRCGQEYLRGLELTCGVVKFFAVIEADELGAGNAKDFCTTNGANHCGLGDQNQKRLILQVDDTHDSIGINKRGNASIGSLVLVCGNQS
jgi:hypothetical protein